jgi:FRG domain
MLEQVLADIEKAMGNDFAGDMPLFRGHSDASWALLPALARRPSRQGLEAIIYYDFMSRAGSLLSDDRTGWNHLFAMQHHGVPTRLLDWTTTFGVALHFATRDGAGDAAIWILDPFLLNSKTWASNTLPSPHELDNTYYQSFIAEEEPFPPDALAMSPIRNNPRSWPTRRCADLNREPS